MIHSTRNNSIEIYSTRYTLRENIQDQKFLEKKTDKCKKLNLLNESLPMQTLIRWDLLI